MDILNSFLEVWISEAVLNNSVLDKLSRKDSLVYARFGYFFPLKMQYKTVI